MMKAQKVLITGGTGSFGQYATQDLLSDLKYKIKIFSRDEQKQEDMRRKHGNNISARQSNKIKEVFDCGYNYYKTMPKEFKKKVGMSDTTMYAVNRYRLLKSLAIYYKGRCGR